MRYHQIVQETWWQDKQIVGRLKPVRLSGRWEAEGPRSRIYPVQSDGDSQHAIALAINTLRSNLGLPAKDFEPVNTQPVLKTTPKKLYHGTSLDHALSIRRTGLIPQVGRFTATAHRNATPMIYASTGRELQRVVAAAYTASHRPETDEDFFDTAAIIVLDNDGHWYYASSSRDDPNGTEPGDYYRWNQSSRSPSWLVMACASSSTSLVNSRATLSVG